ncbi:hypothetical protein WA158_006336 [Blastocystis sp. Blastoise]
MGNTPSKTPEEIFNENKKVVNKAIREIDRQRMTLERRQKTLETEIRKAAKEGKNNIVKIHAKDFIRCKNAVEKCYNMRAQFGAIQMQLENTRATEAMGRCFEGGLKEMSKIMSPEAMQKILAEYSQETIKSENLQEIMGDQIDDAMGDADNEEEEDEVVQSILVEMGINQGESLPGVKTQQAAAGGIQTDDLQSRLDSLNKI